LAAPLAVVVAALAAVAVAGAGRVVRVAWAERVAWGGRVVWAERWVRTERSEDGRPAGARRASGSGADVAERSLRAAGVTAVGMMSLDLQLAGGAQVR
jgi:hypothetical protein